MIEWLKPKKIYVEGKEVIEVFCLDCTFSKKSCYKNGHWVTLTLENGTRCDANDGKIIKLFFKEEKK